MKSFNLLQYHRHIKKLETITVWYNRIQKTSTHAIIHHKKQKKIQRDTF